MTLYITSPFFISVVCYLAIEQIELNLDLFFNSRAILYLVLDGNVATLVKARSDSLCASD